MTRLQAAVLIERYGMDGKGARSLAEVASRRGLTRARVRQLEGRALRALRRLAS